MLFSGKDEYEIHKQEEVLQESLMMIHDCHRRLVKAYDELKILLATEALRESEAYIAAVAVLEEVKAQLPTSETSQHIF
jgi:tubulin-specific chaperone A